MTHGPIDRLASALEGRYRFGRPLGTGGMATVYLAEDLKHRRDVAIKVLRPEVGMLLAAERFRREIDTVAKLTHPHILPLFDSGQCEDLLYYVMPCVRGESLRARIIREGQLPLDDALQITRQVAAALEYAHRQGVAHRDVKPENILLHEGEALLADFGIALAVIAAGEERITQAGLSVGTPEYMSPEQATGEPTDGRSDIYSLGCVLYEMLDGEPPFVGRSPQAVIAKHIADPVPRLRRSRQIGVPALDAVLRQALAKSPADRFTSAKAFSDALSQPVSVVTPPPRSVAVLPFVDMSAQKDQGYFCDGVAEEIINALARVPGLRVISRTSAFQFRDGTLDVREIGEKLSVGSILEGSLRKAGSRVRITAQLVNVSDGFHLWSERYDRELEDIFAIQDDIAGAITDALKVALAPAAHERIERPNVDADTYALYLRGRLAHSAMTPQGFDEAIRFYDQAIARNDSFALAHASRAETLGVAAIHGWADPNDAWPKAKASALRALELDSRLGIPFSVLGGAKWAYDRAFTAAERDYRRALDLNPAYPNSHEWYAFFLMSMGRFEEGLASLQTFRELDPLSPRANALLGAGLYVARRYDDAIAQLSFALEMDSGTQSMYAHWMLGLALLQKGAHQRGVAEIEKANELTRGHMKSWVAYGYAMSGRSADARRILDEMLAQAAPGEISGFDIALIHLGLGEKNQSLDALHNAIGERTAAILHVPHTWPEFEPLRSEPRFRDFTRALGFHGRESLRSAV